MEMNHYLSYSHCSRCGLCNNLLSSDLRSFSISRLLTQEDMIDDCQVIFMECYIFILFYLSCDEFLYSCISIFIRQRRMINEASLLPFHQMLLSKYFGLC